MLIMETYNATNFALLSYIAIQGEAPTLTFDLSIMSNLVSNQPVWPFYVQTTFHVPGEGGFYLPARTYSIRTFDITRPSQPT